MFLLLCFTASLLLWFPCFSSFSVFPVLLFFFAFLPCLLSSFFFRFLCFSPYLLAFFYSPFASFCFSVIVTSLCLFTFFVFFASLWCFFGGFLFWFLCLFGFLCCFVALLVCCFLPLWFPFFSAFVFSFPAVSFLCFYALMVPLHLLVSAVLFLFSISSFSCFSLFPFYHNCNLVTLNYNNYNCNYNKSNENKYKRKNDKNGSKNRNKNNNAWTLGGVAVRQPFPQLEKSTVLVSGSLLFSCTWCYDSLDSGSQSELFHAISTTFVIFRWVYVHLCSRSPNSHYDASLKSWTCLCFVPSSHGSL